MRLKILVLSAVGVSACSGGSAAPGATPAPVSGGRHYESATVRASAMILPDRIRQHITFLASDELGGRDTPSPGLEAAASYLVEALEEAAVTDNLKKVVNTLKKRVTGGAQLSAAMDEQSAVFSNFYVKMVQAGEASGTLPNIFAQIREFTVRDMEAKAKVKKAMRYPMFVVIALILAGYVQISVVLPKMASTMFSNLDELPLPTRIMLGFSDLLSAYGLIFVVIVGSAIAGIKYYTKTPKGGYNFDALMLNLPKIGSMLRSTAVSRFAQMLNVLVSSGVQVVDALAIAGETVDNKVYERDLKKARKDVLGGTAMSVALKSKYMPDMAVSLISIGEKTGALSEMLEGVADYFTSDMDDKIDGLTSAIEPIMTLIITIFVGIFVLAVFMPMIENVTSQLD